MSILQYLLIFVILIFETYTVSISLSGCGEKELQETIDNIAKDGDSIILPRCIYGVEWKDGVHVSLTNTHLTIRGSGMFETVILDRTQEGGTSSQFMSVRLDDGAFFELSDLSILGDRKLRGYQVVSISGSAEDVPKFRVTRVFFKDHYPRPLWVSNIYGLIDHCEFREAGYGSGQFVYIEGCQANIGDVGTPAWERPATWGTTNAVYLEDSLFVNKDEARGGWMDGQCGLRVVARRNLFVNSHITTHGWHDINDLRGPFSGEIYENLWIANASNSGPSGTLRGGTWIFFSNRLIGHWGWSESSAGFQILYYALCPEALSHSIDQQCDTGYPCPDQIGHPVSGPCYEWNNTLQWDPEDQHGEFKVWWVRALGDETCNDCCNCDTVPLHNCGSEQCMSCFHQFGRDLLSENAIEKGVYSPLVYPHPLVTSDTFNPPPPGGQETSWEIFARTGLPVIIVFVGIVVALIILGIAIVLIFVFVKVKRGNRKEEELGDVE